MQSKLNLYFPGQEVELQDLQSISTNAALADDRILAELLRLPMFGAGTVAKGVMPYGLRQTDAAWTQGFPLVAPSAPGLVYVAPFRAVVGTRVATSPNAEAWLTDIRSALVTPTASNGQTLPIAPTAANNRWDLVYCRVDIDAPEALVTRYVKAVDGTQGAQSIAAHLRTRGELGVAQGTEGATPTRPSLPADAGNAYYIPIAYIYLPHPFGVDLVARSDIHEVAPVLGVASPVGGVDCRPATFASAAWTGNQREPEFLPVAMAGKVERFLALKFEGGHEGLPLGATTTIDSSVDWRKRVFKTTIQTNTSAVIPWVGTPGISSIPGVATSSTFVTCGQSFQDDFGAIPGAVGHVADLSNPTHGDMASGSLIQLYVDGVTGHMMAKVNPTSPACTIFLWIEATAPFFNAV